MIELLTIGLALFADAMKARKLAEETELWAEVLSANEAFTHAFYYLELKDLDLSEEEEDFSAFLNRILDRVSLNDSSPVLYIGSLNVPRDLRGQGAGAAIVQMTENNAKKEGALGSVLFSTDVGTGGGPSDRFWRRMGYRVLSEDYYNGYVMYKDFR